MTMATTPSEIIIRLITEKNLAQSLPKEHGGMFIHIVPNSFPNSFFSNESFTSCSFTYLCEIRFHKISESSQESTCGRVSFLINLLASSLNLIDKGTPAQLFSCELSVIAKSAFFVKHLRTIIPKVTSNNAAFFMT